MLRIIEGDLSSIAYDEVKREIKELTKAKKRVFLLVPEQQAVIAEKEIMRELAASASLTFEVTNFTRLANTVYRSLGGIAGEYSTRSKEALLMWKALTELSPVLKMTGGGEVNTGMVEKALAAVQEMKSIAATPETLYGLSEEPRISSNERLKGKLSDIARIMTLYNNLLVEKYTSTRDECERLAAKLSDNPDFFAGAYFFISGFTSFTEPQYEVLRALLRASTVSVHLPMSRRHYEFFEFSEIRKTKERLLSIADMASVKKEIVRREAEREGRNPLLHEICDLVWRNVGEIDNSCLQNAGDTLRIFEARDPYEECDFIAADIKRRVMGGDSYSDFAVIARDSSKYVGLLDTSFDNASIPYFISQRKDVSSFEAVKLILSAFSAVCGGFLRSDVISYAKCRLSGIDTEACDEFELYTEVWGITGDGFLRESGWNMPPDGLGAKMREGDTRLKRINESREKLIAPLVRLRDNLSAAHTVREHARALFLLLRDLSVEEGLYKQSDELLALGESESAEACDKLWDIICSALDVTVEVLGDSEINAEGFINQLKVVLSEVDIGRIPAFLDEVTVGGADMIRLSDKKHVYIIGVNAGEFPRSADTGAYFSDRDKEILSSLGLNTDTDTDIPYARELFFFSRAIWTAKDSVTLLYRTRNEALGAAARSDVIDRIVKLTKEKIQPRKISELPLSDKLYFPAISLEYTERCDVRGALCDSGLGREVALTSSVIENAGHTLTQSTADAIYKGDIPLTQSKIEAYVDCPFAYYLRYNIRISENERAEFDARNIGTFMHAILENFFSEVREESLTVDEISPDRREEMVGRAAKKYLSSVIDGTTETKRQTILLDRLERAALPVVNGLCDELSGCKFVPDLFELKIDKNDDQLPDPVEFVNDKGDSSYVYGFIDRVDTYKSGEDVYVRVIDYKTGAKSFSPSDIDEGKNLQMFLYLKAIVDTKNETFKQRIGVGDGGRLIPAGVIYVKTDLSDATVARPDPTAQDAAIAKKQDRRGMILDDKESIDAMHKDYIPVKYTKTGEPNKRTANNLYTLAEWDEMGERMSRKIGEITERMRAGDISLADSHGGAHCDSCKFKPICRKSK